MFLNLQRIFSTVEKKPNGSLGLRLAVAGLYVREVYANGSDPNYDIEPGNRQFMLTF